MKTLVFCTAFSNSQDRWQKRFARWIQAVENTGIECDQILLADDGSSVMPDCFEYDTITSVSAMSDARVLFLKQEGNLGRPAILDYPGWYRSFASAIAYAKTHEFEKVIHIESDLFVYSQRLITSINQQHEHWRTFWCAKYQFPESALQVIAGHKAIAIANEQTSIPYDTWRGRAAENYLKFDIVDKSFLGDRFGEHYSAVPDYADFAAQIDESWATSRSKF
jgi:hypothetical protein